MYHSSKIYRSVRLSIWMTYASNLPNHGSIQSNQAIGWRGMYYLAQERVGVLNQVSRSYKLMHGRSEHLTRSDTLLGKSFWITLRLRRTLRIREWDVITTSFAVVLRMNLLTTPSLNAPALQTWALASVPYDPGVFPSQGIYTNLDYLLWKKTIWPTIKWCKREWTRPLSMNNLVHLVGKKQKTV